MPLTRLHVAAGDLFLGEAGGANGFILHSRSAFGYDFLQITSQTGGTWEWGRGITFVRSTGNVGIGTTAPHSAALLELSASNKGFLPTRVALTAANLWPPLTGNSVDGMMVYNTATAGTGQNAVTPGYYYWRNGLWRRFSENAYSGMIQGVLTTPPQNLTTNCPGWQYLNSYIDLPPGRWIVYTIQLMSPSSISSSGSIWVRTMFSDNTGCSGFSPDVVGSPLLSGLLPNSSEFGLVIGQSILNNTSGAVKRYYYCGHKQSYSGYNANLIGFSTTTYDFGV